MIHGVIVSNLILSMDRSREGGDRSRDGMSARERLREERLIEEERRRRNGEEDDRHRRDDDDRRLRDDRRDRRSPGHMSSDRG